MTRTAGAPMGCQRPSRFWGLGCPKIYHEAEDTLVQILLLLPKTRRNGLIQALGIGITRKLPSTVMEMLLRCGN
ncbi:hypothetical protein, partial [Thiolapillus sp.]|uniref:hypothetical protein n=1 Tax=Thiolapillus sp. TaxID=2017437 RepID=UPI003AF70AEE